MNALHGTRKVSLNSVQFLKVRGHLQLYHAYIHESSPPMDTVAERQGEVQEVGLAEAEPGWEMLDSAEGAVGGEKEGQLVEEEGRYLKLVVTQLVIPIIVALPSLQGGRRGKMLMGGLTKSTTSPGPHSGSTPASRR